MFGIGGLELFLILLFGFLLFGPDKLPAIAQTVGKAIAKFRSAQEEMSGKMCIRDSGYSASLIGVIVLLVVSFVVAVLLYPCLLYTSRCV